MIPGTRTPSRRTTRSGLLTTVTITVGLLALTGCSGASNPNTGTGSTPSPTLSATATATATGTPTPSRTGPVPPTPLGYTPDDPKGIGSWVEVRGPSTTTPEQKAVMQTWTTYWRITTQAVNSYGLNLSSPELVKTLDNVATGAARRAVIDGVSDLNQKREQTVGPGIFTVQSVQIVGDRAIIRGCMNDQTYEVNERGETVEPPPGVSRLEHTLIRSGGRWRVSATPVLPGKCAS